MRVAKIQAVIVADTQQFDAALARSDQLTKAFSGGTARSFKTLDKQLKALADAGGMSEKSIKALSAQLKSGLAGESAARALNRIARAANLTDAEIRKLATSIGLGTASGLASRFNADNKAAGALQSTLGQLKAVFAGYVGLDALRNVAKTSIDYASIEKSFFAITGSTAGAREEMTYLREEASRLGLDFFALAESFKGFSAAGKSAGMQTAQVREIFTAVTEASAVMGLSSDRTKLALYALEQMLSKGAVSMEELRRQLGDQLPGAFQIAAKSMGMTTQEFAKLVETGRLSSAEFLPKFAAGIREAFGPGLAEAVKTPRAELQRLVNEITLAKVQIGEGGFLQGLSGAAKDLAASLKSDDMQSSLRQLGLALGEITGLAGKLGVVVIQNGTGLMSLAAGMGAATIATRALAPALAGVAGLAGKIVGGGGLAALVTPAGAATAAIGAAAAGIAYLSLQQSEGEKYAAKYAESIAAIAAGGDVTAGALDKMREEVRKISAEMRALESQKTVASINDINRQMQDLFQKGASISQAWEQGGFSAIFDAETALAGPFAKLKSMALDTEAFRKEVAKIGASTGMTDVADQLIKLSHELEEANTRQRELNNTANHTNAAMGIAAMSADGYAAALANLSGQMRLVSEYGKDIDQAAGKTLNMGKFLSAMDSVGYKDLTLGLSDVDKKVAEGLKGIGLSSGEIKRSLSGDVSFLPKMADRARVQEYIGTLRDVATEEDRLNKSRKSGGGAGARGAIFQAAEAYEKLSDATEQFSLKNAELMEQLRGVGLSSALMKIERSYESQLAAIEKSERELIANRQQYAKTGKTDTYENALLEIEAQKRLLLENRALNEALAQRADLEKTLKANSDYAKITGDGYALYDAEVKLLSVEYDKTANLAEQAVIRENIRAAEAYRDKDILYGMGEAFRKYGSDAADVTKQISEATTNAMAGMEDALVAFVTTGKLNFSDLANSIISDLARIAIRQSITGPLASGIGSVIGGLFGGGSGVDVGSIATPGHWLGGFSTSAKGNVFSSPALSHYTNSVVSAPTLFPFARGIGLMGEAGPEAIMPLRRVSGKLGVDAAGLGSQQPPQVNVIVNTPPGVAVTDRQQTQNAQGGFDITIMLEMVDKAMASGIASGRSKTANAMKMRGI